MPLSRMQAVYAVAQRYGLVIVEDDAYYWLQFPSGEDDVPGLNLPGKGLECCHAFAVCCPLAFVCVSLSN